MSSALLRRHLFGLAKVYDCHTLDVRPEGRGKWRVIWTDGPSLTLIRTSLEREFPDLAAGIRYDRETGVRPGLVAALRAVAAASDHDLELLDEHRLESWADEHLDDVSDPWGCATVRERAMVERLLALTVVRDEWGDVLYESWDNAIAELVRRRALAWLLDPADDAATPGRQAETDVPGEGLELTPLELLTVRFATGADRTAWVRQARPMSADRVFAAAVVATAAGTLTRKEALAVLGLVAGRRAELDAVEARTIDTARATGATWSEVGTVLGMTKQSAAERRKRLDTTASGST